MTDNIVNKNDFIEIRYTGKANGIVFDSNIEEDLKKLDLKVKPRKIIIIVGQEMTIKGLDNAIENKEVGKEYEITLKPKDAFGERDRNLIKTIPLNEFTQQNFNPKPGMVLTLDNMLVKIIAVSGARVVTDFNNPLAGKEIHYKFIIIRKVTEEKEKAEALLEYFFKFIPEFKIEKDKIILKGPRGLEKLIKTHAKKFKELLGKEIILEEKSQASELEKKLGQKNTEN